MRIAIVGAGVAGPTLAYWLNRGGHKITLIEAAPAPRTGGYVIDFWGAGYTIAERMGLRSKIHEAGYAVDRLSVVDGQGRQVAGFKGDKLRRALGDRYTSLARGDLATLLLESVGGGPDVLFGETVTGLETADAEARLELARAGSRVFDLVIGADGLHSAVRELAFGPQSAFELKLGYQVAAFEARGYQPRDELTYITFAAPGRQIARFTLRDERTLFLFVYETMEPAPDDLAGRKALLRRIFGNDGWEAPQILDAMDAAPDLYLDPMSQIQMPRWSQGRVALIGDAAACPSLLAGEGSGLAMTEAYVLAGELAAADGDPAVALPRFEQRLRPLLAAKQESARKFAGYFAPSTPLGLWIRNQAMNLINVPGLGEMLLRRDLRDDFELPNYPI